MERSQNESQQKDTAADETTCQGRIADQPGKGPFDRGCQRRRPGAPVQVIFVLVVGSVPQVVHAFAVVIVIRVIQGGQIRAGLLQQSDLPGQKGVCQPVVVARGFGPMEDIPAGEVESEDENGKGCAAKGVQRSLLPGRPVLPAHPAVSNPFTKRLSPGVQRR